MSILIENNEIHLIGNVEDGYIDQYVLFPFLTSFSMFEDCKYQEIKLHLSGKNATFDITPIVDCIEKSKIPVDVYIHNSEEYNGYKGVDGELLNILSKARKVYDVKHEEYNPPLHLALAEIHMMREYDMYGELNEDEEEDDEEDEYYNI